MIAQAGFYSMFFFVTLYMQSVLGFSPIEAGAAYVPVTIGVGMATGIATKLLPRTGTRPIIMAGALGGAAGVFYLSRIPVHGSYLADVLPGLVVMALVLGAIFVGVQTAANAGVPADKAGLAAALATASAQLGSALGLAVFTAIATSRTQQLLASHVAAQRGADLWLPACARCLQHLPRRCGGDRKLGDERQAPAGAEHRAGSRSGCSSRIGVVVDQHALNSAKEVNRGNESQP